MSSKAPLPMGACWPFRPFGWIVDGYRIMHLSMGYDGIQSKKICDEGFNLARSIIDRCEAMRAS